MYMFLMLLSNTPSKPWSEVSASCPRGFVFVQGPITRPSPNISMGRKFSISAPKAFQPDTL